MSSKFYSPLSETQAVLYNILNKRKGEDIPILDLYSAISPGPEGHTTNAARQRAIGPHIARINQKLVKGKIVPGSVKRTYRLEV